MPGKIKQTEPTGPRPHLANLLRAQVTLINRATPSLRWANVFHMLGNNPVAPSVTDLNTYANAFMTAYANAFKQLVTAGYDVKLCDVSMLDGSGVKGTASGTIACTQPDPAMPPQAAVVISWQTYAYYRGGKPRTYLGGVPTTVTTSLGSAALDPTKAGQVHTQATSFRNAVNAIQLAGVGATLGFVQYFKNYTMLPTPVFYGFVGEKVHERLDTQRKRLGRESLYGIV